MAISKSDPKDIMFKELETWFHDRPNWLQDAARRLVQNDALSERDYEELQIMCIREASNQEVTFCGLYSGSLARV